MADKLTDPYIFLDKALGCNSKNRTLKELTALLNDGTEIKLSSDESQFFKKIEAKQQGMRHLSGLIDIKMTSKRFVINLVVGVIGVVLGATVSILTNIFKYPPPC